MSTPNQPSNQRNTEKQQLKIATMEVEGCPTAPQRKKRRSRKEQKSLKKLRKRNIPDTSEPQTNERNSQSKPKDPSESIQSSCNKNEKQDNNDFKLSYIPTPLTDAPNTGSTTKGAAESVGKWFPKAEKLKRQAPPPNVSCSILLFYQYAEPKLSSERVEQLRLYLLDIGRHRPTLAGRIRIAPEGLNCTLSAVDDDSDGTPAAATIRHFTYDLQQQFDAKLFGDTDFKFLDHLTADRHFRQLTLLPVQELVYYGLDEKEAPLHEGGKHVSPQEFHRLLENGIGDASDDSKQTVVVDVRNHYEAAIGRFDGSTAVTYLDPKMRKSTDFSPWLQQSAPDLQGKRVLMYCTGGVRCERASAHVKHLLGSEQEVFQLQGGIERYLQEFPDGGYWRGKNFTFDKREAVSASNFNGDGGVVKKDKAEIAAIPGCKCVVCATPWDRYIGKKKCHTCGVPVLVCDSCLTDHRDRESMRCPLCVEQSVTVKVEDVDWTNNGTKAGSGAAGEAPSVLKWGGGHAKEKKRKRQLQRKACKFGSECLRKDCMFSHPVDWGVRFEYAEQDRPGGPAAG